MDMEKYLFYFQRYVGHEQAGKFAAKTRALAQKRMADLALAGGATMSWSEVSFLEAATEALLECRRVLKHTYIYGYYMEDGSEKRLFEHLQEQLERSTEHLQELTETSLEKMDRGEVVNFTRVVSTFLRNLLEGIDAGLTM
jgi:ariadne-1